MCILELTMIVAIVGILLLLMSYFNTPRSSEFTESFDVYQNHRRGAKNVYDTTGIPSTGKIEKLSPKEAEILAKYTWSYSDPQGLDVYDHYYENYVRNNKYADQRPDTASDNISYREIDNDNNEGSRGGSVYDVKFHVYSGLDGYTDYSISGMVDPDPLYMEFNGQAISLNQKNF